MTQDLRTRPAESGGPADNGAAGEDDEFDGYGITLSEIFSGVFDWIWRFFISKKTGMTLILGMGLLTLIGTLLPQAPSGLRGDPQAYQSWLDTQRGKYAGWTTPLNALGMFQVFSSIWFKAVTLLLAVSILACSFNRFPRLWRGAFRPRTRVPDSFFDRSPLRQRITAPAPPEQVIGQVRAALRSHGLRIVTDPQDEHRLYADRFRMGPFGTILAHLAFVVILIGMLVTASTGFKEPQFAVPVGSRVDVGHGTGLTVEAKSFSDSWYLDGSPKDYASVIALYRGGRKVAERTVRVNQPLRYDGISFYQAFYGNAATIRVKDSTGRALFDTGVPLVWASDDGKHVIGEFTLPSSGLTVYVVSSASGETDAGIPAGSVLLQFYKNGTSDPTDNQVISQGKPTTISGLTYEFVRETQFTGLIVGRDNGAMLVWTGSALMVLGLYMVFFFQHRRMWVRVRRTPEGSEILCGSPTRRDAAFERRFGELVADLTLAAAEARAGSGSGTEPITSGAGHAAPASGTTTKVGPEDA